MTTVALFTTPVSTADFENLRIPKTVVFYKDDASLPPGAATFINCCRFFMPASSRSLRVRQPVRRILLKIQVRIFGDHDIINPLIRPALLSPSGDSNFPPAMAAPRQSNFAETTRCRH